MRQLLLIGFGLLLTICTYGQGMTIAELEAASVQHNDGTVFSEPLAILPIIDKLPTAIMPLPTFAIESPISIRQVPRTIYWGDKLEASKSAEVTKSTEPVESTSVVYEVIKPTSNTNTNNVVSKPETRNPILGFAPLSKKSAANKIGLIYTKKQLRNLPFGIQQVNRTIYLTDKLEAYYAKQKGKSLDSDADKNVVNRIEEEVIQVNSTTSSETSRRDIISKRELKAIVRRAKGKKDDYTEEAYTEATNISKKSIKSRIPSDNFVETKVTTSFHKEHDDQVVNRELAVLEKMMNSADSGGGTTSMATPTNVNIPVTTQPLEVTSEIINGESVITEIKPVSTTSSVNVTSSTTTTTSAATTTTTSAAPYTVAGEDRSIRADPFSLNTIDNELISTNQLKGKVVVLNFWFTSCVECIREVPHLNDLKDRYEGQAIEFLGICLNDKSQIQSFLKQHPFEWKQIPNAREVAHNFYMFAYPGHAVVDKNGGIITLLNGNDPDVMTQLETAIQVGLGEHF